MISSADLLCATNFKIEQLKQLQFEICKIRKHENSKIYKLKAWTHEHIINIEKQTVQDWTIEHRLNLKM